ncbi:hypothetical protein SD427_14090 [Chryseobacterium sp. JJR-5R]|uniref:hypothetical protein n=1 Tax=Chryseobacterium sp. JJR-5R TaxID=3093923 RepID=UPI002A7478C6|nr:hypothetical protein [Chryseobacterium sp. JJR-5R]WPO81890.1 hypothetical protein SD427_14090 [Chryseobacterium sp. JJR-5R]
MNIKLNLLALTISLITLSCNNKESTMKSKELDSISLLNPENQLTEGTNVQTKAESGHNNIKLIDSKKEIRELDDNFNQMTIFEIDKNTELNQLKHYCSANKSDYTDGYFQILVFFNKPNSARFPDNPITALHNEEKDLKNIKAVYTINNMNGYSKLSYYEKNKWESLVQIVDVN